MYNCIIILYICKSENQYSDLEVFDAVYEEHKALQPKITSIRRMFNVTLGAHQNTSAAECSFHMWEVSNIRAKVGSLMWFWGFLLWNWDYSAFSTSQNRLLPFQAQVLWCVQFLCSCGSAKVFTRVSRTLCHGWASPTAVLATKPQLLLLTPPAWAPWNSRQTLHGKSTEYPVNKPSTGKT